jgi:hypothetical protein
MGVGVDCDFISHLEKNESANEQAIFIPAEGPSPMAGFIKKDESHGSLFSQTKARARSTEIGPINFATALSQPLTPYERSTPCGRSYGIAGVGLAGVEKNWIDILAKKSATLVTSNSVRNIRPNKVFSAGAFPSTFNSQRSQVCRLTPVLREEDTLSCRGEL